MPETPAALTVFAEIASVAPHHVFYVTREEALAMLESERQTTHRVLPVSVEDRLVAGLKPPPAFGTREWFLAEPFSWEQDNDYHRTNDGPEGEGWRYEYVARDFGTCTERRLILHVDAAGQFTDEEHQSELPALAQARMRERWRCAKIAREYAEELGQGSEDPMASAAIEVAKRIEASPAEGV